MLSLQQVERQLEQVGCNFRVWGRPEIRELANLMVPGETIAKCTNGHYEGGFGLLVVTSHRLLLVDRKTMFLTVEDIRFHTINEIQYKPQLLFGAVNIITNNRRLSFTGWSTRRARELVECAQLRIIEAKQQYVARQFNAQYQENAAASASRVGELAMQSHSEVSLPSFPFMWRNPYATKAFLGHAEQPLRRF